MFLLRRSLKLAGPDDGRNPLIWKHKNISRDIDYKAVLLTLASVIVFEFYIINLSPSYKFRNNLS